MVMAATTPPPAFEALPVQQELLGYVADGRHRYVGFGGGVRGTKTWGSLATLIALCRVFPGSRWGVVRKDLERIKKNTVPSFEKLAMRAGGFVGRVNRADWYAECANGSRILFFGENVDKDPELLRWHGFEVNGFVLEEADELSERSFTKAIERAGAWIVPEGAQPDPVIIATFNPTPRWPKRVFYDPWSQGTIRAPYAFVPATIADNPYAPEAYRESLKHLPEAEYKRFVEGDWSVLTGRYYDMLDARTHIIQRDALPNPLPGWWEYWVAYDWGYAHWAVMGLFARDGDGTSFLIDSTWLRKQQDDEQARAMADMCAQHGLDARRLDIYAGHDVRAKYEARGATGISTQEVFEAQGIALQLADVDRVNGGRAVQRALAVREGRATLYIVNTPGNVRVFDQLAETMPDEKDVRKPAKVNADSEGNGGDDGGDMLRYGVATRVLIPAAPVSVVWERETERDTTDLGTLLTSPTSAAGDAYSGLPAGF